MPAPDEPTPGVDVLLAEDDPLPRKSLGPPGAGPATGLPRDARELLDWLGGDGCGNLGVSGGLAGRYRAAAGTPGAGEPARDDALKPVTVRADDGRETPALLALDPSLAG